MRLSQALEKSRIAILEKDGGRYLAASTAIYFEKDGTVKKVMNNSDEIPMSNEWEPIEK